MRRPIARAHVHLAVALAAALSSACGAVSQRPAAPSPQLPAYAGHATELFDDGIGAQVIGPGVEPSSSPRERNLLRERTHQGDRVVRARVVAFTSTQDESGPRWLLSMHTVETLTGDGHGQDDFTVRIDGKAQGAGIVRALGGGLIGAPLVAFLRDFAAAEGSGERELHFHLSGDGKAEVDAIRIAALDGESGP
jgi:hypothetical protein